MQILTTSSKEENFIVYDENEAFVNVDLGKAKEANAFQSWSEATPQPMNSEYTMSFSVRTSQPRIQKIEIVMENAYFRFTKTDTDCVSGSLAANVDYFCRQKKANVLQILLRDFMAAGVQLTFSVKVQLPQLVAQANVRFLYMKSDSQEIVEEGVGGLLRTAAETWATRRYLVGWGLDYTSQSSSIIALLKNNIQSTVYNSVKFEFKPANNLIGISHPKYRVRLVLGRHIQVLPGSVQSELPFISAAEQFCEVYQANNALEDAYIQCDGVGSLLNAPTYMLAARITIANGFTDFASHAPSFGRLAVYPYVSSLGDYYMVSSMYDSDNAYAVQGQVYLNEGVVDHVDYHGIYSQIASGQKII